MNDTADLGEDHWRTSLSEEQFEITRRKGAEHPFSREYYDCKIPGTYECACWSCPDAPGFRNSVIRFIPACR